MLSVKNLCKTYSGFSLREVSFEVGDGRIMGFVGPNGAGKTTTIKSIMGLIRKEGGTVEFDGRDMTVSPKSKEAVGFVSDDAHYWGGLDPRGIAAVLKPFYAAWDSERFLALLDDFRIPADKKSSQFSKGMKMKLSIALALARDARLLILDEPTSGIDPVDRVEVLDKLKSASAEKGTSVLFSTHITTDLERIADDVSFIVDGRIVLSGAMGEILAGYKTVHFDAGAGIAEPSVFIDANASANSALVEASKLSLVKNAARVEDATVEDVIVGYTRAMKKGEIHV